MIEAIGIVTYVFAMVFCWLFGIASKNIPMALIGFGMFFAFMVTVVYLALIFD